MSHVDHDILMHMSSLSPDVTGANWGNMLGKTRGWTAFSFHGRGGGGDDIVLT